MAFGTNTQINNETMSMEDYEKHEDEMRQRAFGIYEDKQDSHQSILDVANQSLHNDDIANLNRAEYESILDSYGASTAPTVPNNQAPVMQQAPQVQQQPVQPSFVQPVQPQQQQSQQPLTGQPGQVPQQVAPAQTEDNSSSSDFLASLFQDDVTGTQTQVPPVTPVVPPVTPQFNTIPTQQSFVQPPQQQVAQANVNPISGQVDSQAQFKRELASIAMHNKVNPNTVFQELESLPVEEMYNFLAAKAYQRKSQQAQIQATQQQSNSSVRENLAKLMTPSVTKIPPVAPRYTDNSYAINHSSDTY